MPVANPSALRRTGVYAEVDGRLFESTGPLPGEPVILRARRDSAPAGFTGRDGDEILTRTVDVTAVERFVSVRALADVAGGGPFQIISVPGDGIVGLVYRGGDRDWASSLPGFRVGDRYMDGSEILGALPVDALENLREEHQEFVPPRTDGTPLR